jgi:hypothetical protein
LFLDKVGYWMKGYVFDRRIESEVFSDVSVNLTRGGLVDKTRDREGRVLRILQLIFDAVLYINP